MRLLKQFHVFYLNRHRSSMVRAFMDIWWYAFLRLSFLFVLVGLMFGGWVLYEAWKGVTPAKSGSSTSETLSREALSDAVARTVERQVQYDAAKRADYSIVDPGR